MSQIEAPANDPAGPAPAPSAHEGSRIAAVWRMLNDIIRQIGEGNERGRAQRNAIVAFAVRVASAGLLYLMQVAMARWMGTFEYGLYVFVWTWVLILGGLSPLGLNLIVIRLMPEYAEKRQTRELAALNLGAPLVAFTIGTAVAAMGLALLSLLQDMVSSHYLIPLMLGLVCVPLYALGDVLDGMGRGRAWMALALVPPYILRPLIILGTMLAANVLGFEMTAVTATGAAIVGTWVSAMLQLALISRQIIKADAENRVSGGEDVRAESAGARSVLRQAGGSFVTAWTNFGVWVKLSAPLLVITACELLLQNTDVLIISRYMDPSDVGIYFAAAKTMSLILFVHYAVGSAVANRFSALRARGDEEELKRFVADSVAWTFWPSLLAAVAILTMGHQLLSLFGEQFGEKGFPVMLILVVGFLFRSAMGPADYLLNMLGEQTRCATVLVATACLNVVLNLVLVAQFGLIGAACATSISLSVAALLHYLVVRSRLGFDIAIWRNIGN